MDAKIKTLILFHKEDRHLFQELKQHLAPLEREGLITLWDEDRVLAGTDRKEVVDLQLKNASLILLLLSASFMASETYDLAVQALAKHTPPTGYVIPILLHPVDWQHSVFGRLAPLPANGVPISIWSSRPAAYLDVVKGIREIVAAYKQQSSVSVSATQRNSSEEIQMSDSAKDQPTAFDVFLCHNSKDKDEVKEVAKQLQAHDIRPWLDEWELPPGQIWQPLVEEQIKTIPSAAVFVSKNDMGPWQKPEMYALLSQFVQRGCPVIPVLLDTAPIRPDLPVFLANMTWVDFRKREPDPLKQLIWGITGKKPDSHAKHRTANRTTSASTSPSPKTLSLTLKFELADILLACKCISNRESRETVLGLLNQQFSGIVNRISRRSDNQMDVMEILSTCENQSGSLRAFCEIVMYFEGNSSINAQSIRKFMQQHSL
jgi:TIR domain/Effector-associated domain 2